MTEQRYDAYNPLAWIYNKYWGGEIYNALPFLEKVLLNHLHDKALILDLCCGSGQAVCALLERKYIAVGLDGSNEILEYARKNAPEGEFVLADARMFNIEKKFDAIISLADALNHLMTIEDVRKVFSNVYAHLKPNGDFLFDLNMEKNFIERWKDHNSCIIEPDHVVAVQAQYDRDDKLCEFNASIFKKVGDNWNRNDVTLFQRCYSKEEIIFELKAAGFEKINPIDATIEFGTSMKNHLYFHCKKPKK